MADAIQRARTELNCIGHIINDAPYRAEERDGAWQCWLENKKQLDAALSLLSVPAQTDDQVIADQTRALLRTTMKSHQDGYAHAKKQIRFLLFRQREWIHADRLNGLLSAIDALESTDGLSPIDEETQIASVSVSPSAAGQHGSGGHGGAAHGVGNK